LNIKTLFYYFNLSRKSSEKELNLILLS